MITCMKLKIDLLVKYNYTLFRRGLFSNEFRDEIMEKRIRRKIYLLIPSVRNDPGKNKNDMQIDDKNLEKSKKNRWLYCTICSQPVVRKNKMINVDGSHQHTFLNPHGIVYQIGCFQNAPGCSGVGSYSSEFSWFAGYKWKIMLCSKCSVHLGWQFISDNTSFFGLLLERLKEK